MERETRLELATPSLARKCSTTELLSQSVILIIHAKFYFAIVFKWDLYTTLHQICLKYSYDVILYSFQNLASLSTCAKPDILYEINSLLQNLTVSQLLFGTVANTVKQLQGDNFILATDSDYVLDYWRS